MGGGPHLCARLACMGHGSSREGPGSCSSFCVASARDWVLLCPSSSSSTAPQGSTPGPRYRRVAALGSSLSTEDSDGPGAGGQAAGRVQASRPPVPPSDAGVQTPSPSPLRSGSLESPVPDTPHSPAKHPSAAPPGPSYPGAEEFAPQLPFPSNSGCDPGPSHSSDTLRYSSP